MRQRAAFGVQADDVQDQARDHALRLAVPMTLLPIRNDHQFGERFGVILFMDGIHANHVEWIEAVGCVGISGIEHSHWPEFQATAMGDRAVLSLYVGTDN